MMKRKYECPCCSKKTLDNPIGGFDICPVCSWEADMIESTESDYNGGPNGISLKKAKINFKKYGTSKPKFKILNK